MLRNFLFPFFGCCFFVTAFAQTQKVLTNEDVIKLVKAGFQESLIIKEVESNGSAFDTSVSGLLALKDAGVGDKIIEAIITARAKDQPSATPENRDGQPALITPKSKQTKQESTTFDQPALYVEEVSSEGGDSASPDTNLEAIKTLRKKGMRVVTIRDKADYILQVTRQLGQKSWSKDTKVVLVNREGEVVYANSTRSIGGAMGDVVDFIRKRKQ